ncbi:XRE family transcriptional regulator [Candidatus Shapirobacteria bacterium CG09_land_8_20_14_0_10_39_12]|uniref:XRE family transcriptional regulator n=1 Tax=Candidatus Shapirobacteria bacterium CG09_land_8_20_14_0_10_39_12 TaxID=1974885 RepID=A0A2H0WQF7_9BACT|nr:MAG: XRE family transcriptional regulator [Candidatus Shapirobacteria bacterium CG09_land_8_20_14_0_10_39_12]
MISKDAFTKKVGENIKRLREERGLSQEELAHQAGLYRTYIGHLENARYSASAYVLYKLACVLKIKSSEFFNF